MDREVFRVSLLEIHTQFTVDKLTRKDKDGDARKILEGLRMLSG